MASALATLTSALVALAGQANAAELARDGAASAAIVLCADPTLTERTAANELAHYLSEVTGAKFVVTEEASAAARGATLHVGGAAFAVRNGAGPAKLGPEEWIVRAVNGHLILVGGRPRGTLYAVYHFLEDVVGVHWWNPWEEHVPKRPTLKIPDDLDLRGKPVLRYRDIYMLYGNDGGRFAARNRLNRQGDAAIAPEYGGGRDYGPPYHVHTFYLYFPPKQYFEKEPELFSLINGKRDADRKQLCLTNPGLRQQFLAKLRAFIESSLAAAKEQGKPAPVVFDVSQNDWGGACQCNNCQAIAEAEESEAGPLLDFVNFLADAIKEDHPGVYLDTLAYQYTQKPPKAIKPRDNVIIRLCDTTSTFTRAITDPENKQFHDFLLSWSKIAKNLRIWDYAVTYAAPRGLPFPSVQTFQADFRFYAEHNVEGVFTELEYPVLADLRDLKVWMMMKLLEDPNQGYDELLRTFTDGFYGPAGSLVREYLTKLEAASKAHPTYVSMGASPSSFAYCDFDFVSQAQALFDQAERVAASAKGVDSAVLLRRLRHARLALDRATLVLFRGLTQQWIAKGNAPEDMPLDRDAIAARVKATWHAEIDRRIPAERRPAETAKADSELAKYAGLQPNLDPPVKFRDLPRQRLFDFTADMTRNWKNIAKVVKDDEAESGITNRLEFPTTIDTDKQPVERYRLPMPWGLYDQINKKSVASAALKAEDVPGPGYHWYKLGTHKLAPSYYLYFFWSWIIQVDLESAIDPTNPDQEFEIWARIKFEGPTFPHGRKGEKDAICVERVVLVKAGR